MLRVYLNKIIMGNVVYICLNFNLLSIMIHDDHFQVPQTFLFVTVVNVCLLSSHLYFTNAVSIINLCAYLKEWQGKLFLTFQGDPTCPAEWCGDYEWPITRAVSYARFYCHEGLTGQ